MRQPTVLCYLGINERTARVPRDLKIMWLLTFGSLAAAFPVYTFLVFGLDIDRRLVANIMTTQVAFSYWLGFLAALLPLKGLRQWSRMRRIHMVVVPYLLCSVLTHLIWEGLWVALHKPISASRDAAWAYSWWGYIDGGDMRYFNPTTNFLAIEILSVINGVIGAVGLFLLFRSKFQNPLGTLMVMTVAVVETVLTYYYFGTEILNGFDNVNMTFMDLGVKFIFLNAPWLVLPWFVLYWGYRILHVELAQPEGSLPNHLSVSTSTSV
ncbi:MAG: hypothetical protein NVS4B6_06810 [Mycobacterium sp.]